jgi:hypothetical protein
LKFFPVKWVPPSLIKILKVPKQGKIMILIIVMDSSVETLRHGMASTHLIHNQPWRGYVWIHVSFWKAPWSLSPTHRISRFVDYISRAWNFFEKYSQFFGIRGMTRHIF